MAIVNQISNGTASQYIVTGTLPGPYHTIQSAINQAVADGVTTATVIVRPGTYTENLTLYSGIDIEGADKGRVIIIGHHVPPAAGTFSISNCTLRYGTSIFILNVIAANITVNNCIFDLTTEQLFFFPTTSGVLTINNCTDISTSNAILSSGAATATLNILNSSVGAGTSPLSVVNGIVRVINSNVYCPINLVSASALYVDGSVIDTAATSITVQQASDVSIYNSHISSGANPCIDTTAFATTGLTILENVVLDSSAGSVIAGLGQIELGEVVFSDVKVIAGTITYANASTLGASNVNLGNILFLAGSAGAAGQVLTSNGVAAPTWQTNSSFGWVEATASMPLAINTGYITKIAVPGLLTYTLPAVAAQGTIIEITGFTAGGFLVAQNALQSINHGALTSTIGVGGSLASTSNYDSLKMVCVTANTTWNVVSSQGNFTVV